MEHKTINNLKEVQYIKNLEKVTPEITNRPHKDIVSNINFLSSGIDTDRGGVVYRWDEGSYYQIGDVVSFGSSFYISLTKDNLGNRPKAIPFIPESDTHWRLLGSSKFRKVLSWDLDRATTTRVNINEEETGSDHYMTGDLLPQRLISPMVRSNGKYFSVFSLEAKKRYRMVKSSRYHPLHGEYILRIQYTGTSDDLDFPEEAYVVLEISHTGYSYNTSGIIVPSVFIKECHCNRAVSEYMDKRSPKYWDRFGPYGISVIANAEFDGSASIDIVTKYDCTISVTGSYDVEPLFNPVSYEDRIIYVNHLVRPFGGDLATNVGAVVAYDGSLTRKQVWDRGLLWRFKPIAIKSDVYSLFFISKGYVRNYMEFPIGTKPADIPALVWSDAGMPPMSKTFPPLSNRVLRGVGSLTPTIGRYQEDAIRNITGSLALNHSNLDVYPYAPTAPKDITGGAPVRAKTALFGGEGAGIHPDAWTHDDRILIDASRVVPTAPENRVKSIAVEFYSQTH